MTLTLILPWFPIILAVGVGARLLGRTRGIGLGVICALFWIVLSQASGGAQVWATAWSLGSIIAGAFAIVAMGAWAGDAPITDSEQDATLPSGNRGPGETGRVEPGMRLLAEAVDRFDDWRACGTPQRCRSLAGVRRVCKKRAASWLRGHACAPVPPGG